MMKKILFFFLSMLLSTPLFAQITVKTDIDSVMLLIGNQANLRLSVVQPSAAFVQFPLFNDTIAKGVEIVERKKADTAALGNNRIEITQDYTITVFDSGLYYIPPMKFVAGKETIESNSLTFKGLTLPVDTANLEIRDIKPVLSPPFSWKLLFLYLFYAWLVLVAIAAIAYIIYRVVKKKPIIPLMKEKPKLPAHVVALQELDKIKFEKLWQQGQEKEFQTQLTDVLRVYIEKRFGIDAMEMTSDEILDKLSEQESTQSVLDNLKQILKSADLVKFAKMKLLPDENDLSIVNSYLFVNQTKIEPNVNVNSHEYTNKHE